MSPQQRFLCDFFYSLTLQMSRAQRALYLIYTSLSHRMVAPKFSNNLTCLSAVGVAPCGNHSSSRKRRGAGGCTPSRVVEIRFWRRTSTARPPHRLVSLSVLQQCVWDQTGGQWMPIRRKESFYKETKFASFFLIISSDKKSKRPK